MYIWRKRAADDWVRMHSENLNQRYGAVLAMTEQPGKARALLEISCRTEKEARRLLREFGGSAEKLRTDWLEHFAKQAQTKPLRIGSRLIVRGSPDEKQPNGAVRTIIIPAETAFGTGDHATTAMCLRLLERQTRKRSREWTMLDAGTGTGILAIVGKCLGAGRVLAIDNDPLACTVARRNARANRVRHLQFRTGDVLKEKLKGTFDVIAANLFSEILITALPIWARRLAPGGSLILSGILRSQETAVVAALRRNRWAVREIRRRGKWIAILAFRRTVRKAVPPRKKS